MSLLLALWFAAYTVVDVQRVPADSDPAVALIQVDVPGSIEQLECDVLVAGGGPGGVAAALRVAQRGQGVCLTEETDTLGGQFHSVPALDEHKFIEITGGTRSYYDLRNRIRDYYRRSFRLTAAGNRYENLNPGACYVSSLCYEPKVAVNAIEEMLKKYEGKIRVLRRTKIIDLVRNGARIESALAYGFETKKAVRIRLKFILDATETGELLPLAKVPYVVGSESRGDTAEPHAAPAPNPACVQSFTYTFAVEHRPGEDHRISRPDGYENIRDSQPFSLRMNYPEEFGWKGYVQYSVFGEDSPVPNNMSPRPFFPWRRILASKNFEGVQHDVALMNWPRQDYHTESLLDRSPADTVRILQAAKRVSLAFLYWMQNDMPRDEGTAKGYGEFLLRKDVMGSDDGLSKYPYIRESRRLRTKGRVLEQDLKIDEEGASRARAFEDSIGTGFYMVDIHPCGANERGRMMMPKPFQIPMATLVPQGVDNLLAAGKNLGVTHLTNGAFRLHPIEWNIGEAAGLMASLAIEKGALPSAQALQPELARAGVPLVWFDDLPVGHPAFAAIQVAAVRNLYPLDQNNLHASPDSPVTRREAAEILSAFFGKPLGGRLAIEHAVQQGWMAVDHRNWFHADLPLYWTDWREERFPRTLPRFEMRRSGPVTRAELARRLSGL